MILIVGRLVVTLASREYFLTKQTLTYEIYDWRNVSFIKEISSFDEKERKKIWLLSGIE